MLRVVLDTSVIVSALRSISGASNQLLRLVARAALTPLVTPALFLEYEDVLKRPAQMNAHGLGTVQVDRFLAAFASAAEPVSVRFQWRPQLSDPGDEMVLEAAVNGRAAALITHNVRDFEIPALKFGLRVLRPGPFLEELRV